MNEYPAGFSPLWLPMWKAFQSMSATHYDRTVKSGRLPSEQVAAFDWNRWPTSVGMGGRLPSEYAIIANQRYLYHRFSVRIQQITLLVWTCCPLRHSVD